MSGYGPVYITSRSSILTMASCDNDFTWVCSFLIKHLAIDMTLHNIQGRKLFPEKSSFIDVWWGLTYANIVQNV